MDKQIETRYTYQAWAEAFAIFAKYDSGRYEVSAEHDIIWAGPQYDVIASADQERLMELGWHVSADIGVFYHHV